MSSNRLKLLLLSVMAVVAISAVASASASAAVATCYMVVEPGTGTYPSSEACEKGEAGNPKEWVMLAEPVEIKEIAAGVACAKVKPTEPSQYSNSTCTTKNVGKGEFTKVKVSLDEWEVQKCEEKEVVGATKFSTNTCETESATGKFYESGALEKLAAGKKRKVTSSGGEFKLKAGTLTVTCKKITDKGTITGGKPGIDLAEEIKFVECTTGTTGCEVKSAAGTLGTIVVTNIPTKLEQVVIGKEEILVDLFESKTVGTTKEFVTLEFSGTSCAGAGYVTTKVKGNVAAEIVTGTGELNFPSVAITGDTLNAFGLAATLTGRDTQKGVGGGKVQAS